MEINPYESPLHGGQTPQPKVRRLRPTLLGCLVVIGILGVLIALFLPARRGSSGAARRMMCGNNLKQIGIALRSYAEQYGALPPAHTVDAKGKPLHSWRTLILPFMEQEPLYRKIDLSKPWDDPANQVAFDAFPPGYSCPSANCPPTQTTYMAIAVPGGCFRPTEPRKLAEITDDPDWTLMVMEVDASQAVHWMSPTDSLDLTFPKVGSGAKLPHANGAHAVTVSGSVRFLSKNLKPEVVRALITIDGNDGASAKLAD